LIALKEIAEAALFVRNCPKWQSVTIAANKKFSFRKEIADPDTRRDRARKKELFIPLLMTVFS
jgi:hypothetical protein